MKTLLLSFLIFAQVGTPLPDDYFLHHPLVDHYCYDNFIGQKKKCYLLNPQVTPTPATVLSEEDFEILLKYEPGDLVFNSETEEIVRFTKDGRIIIAHPDKLDETAKKFIEIIKANWPEICKGNK